MGGTLVTEPLVTWSQSSQFNGNLRDHIYIRVTERYMETLHLKKMADLVAVSL